MAFDLNIDGALIYFNHLWKYLKFTSRVRRKLGFVDCPRSNFQDWETMTCILLRETPGKRHGCDLSQTEVKSAVRREGSVVRFEYQYHRNTGLQKLKHELLINHVFVILAEDYKDIQFWRVPGDSLRPKMELWSDKIVQEYEAGRQRCRMSLCFEADIQPLAHLILHLHNGMVI